VNVLIVDDEPLAREALRNALSGNPRITTLREARDAMQALELLQQAPAEVIMLDIQMPQMDGFAFLRELQQYPGKNPVVIFVTAYDDFAIKAFEEHAADYLLKPFEKRRVVAALERAWLRWQGEQVSSMLVQWPGLLQQLRQRETPKRIGVKSKGRVVFLDPDSINFVLAEGNYFVLHLANGGAHMLRGMMGHIEEQLRPFGFIRIHRSVVINMKVVKEVQPLPSGDYLLRTTVGRDFAVTRKYKSNLSQLMALTIGTPRVTF
jgi:two-component system, LytTR family, response regulator